MGVCVCVGKCGCVSVCVPRLSPLLVCDRLMARHNKTKTKKKARRPGRARGQRGHWARVRLARVASLQALLAGGRRVAVSPVARGAESAGEAILLVTNGQLG